MGASKTLMAKKKPTKRPVVRRAGISLHLYIDAELDAALADFLASVTPRSNKTAVAEAALKDWLAARGCWPRKEG
jgi:hypothetical protein